MTKMSLAGGVALTLGLPNSANAACLMDELTNAASVQADTGNGDYTCSLVTTPTGTLSTVATLGSLNGYTISIEPNGTVTWSAPTDSNGFPVADVDLISVARNSGKRCNYSYPDQPVGGEGLSTSDGGAATSVTICADGVLEPAPEAEPEPEIITSIGDACESTFTAGDTLLIDADVSFGYSAPADGQPETIAICSNQTDDTSASLQRECLPNPPPNPNYSAENCVPGTSGELPLECAPVLSQTENGEKYCWYYENQVCDENTEEVFKMLWGCGNSRTDGTYIPRPQLGGVDLSITTHQGSYTYTSCTRSRCWYTP
jgi:hypothetical protein